MNNFKPYYIKNNDGEDLVFQVRKNMTEPCSVCGVPACGKEDILWYKKDNQKVSIIFDGSLLDLELETYLKENLTKDNYSSLPDFIKIWNEGYGWSENWDYNGIEIDKEDFLASIELIEKESKWLSDECFNEMKNLASEAINFNIELKIVRG